MLTDPQWIEAHGGLYLVAFIIFAETGLFVGFFLPGDSLLFVTGVILAQVHNPFAEPVFNLLLWVAILTVCGILGNFVGYWFGKRSGPYLFEREDTFFFKKKYLLQAKDFYDSKGGGAIVLARFVPIVRTFAPIVAGIVKMNYQKFSYYNILGSALWVGSMTTLGFLLGENEWVKKNLDKIAIIVILVTTLPVFYKLIFGNKKETDQEAESKSN